MTFLRHLFPRKPAAPDVEELRQAREEAQARYNDAILRGDTRGQCEARKRLRAATLDCLRAGA